MKLQSRRNWLTSKKIIATISVSQLQFKTSSLHMRTNIRRNKQSRQLTDDLIHFCRYMRILEVIYQTARKVKYIYFYHNQSIRLSWYLYGNWIFHSFLCCKNCPFLCVRLNCEKDRVSFQKLCKHLTVVGIPPGRVLNRQTEL